MNTKFKGFVATLALLGVFIPGLKGAQAVTFPEPTITFTNLTSTFNGPGDPVYKEAGFDFDPTSFQAGNCSPFPTASNPCVKETQQTGTVTTMTPSVAGSLFSLTGFYFDLQGTGGKDPINQLIVSSNKTTSASQLVFQIGQSAPTDTQLYNSYTFSGGVLSGSIYNGAIVNNASYFVTINSSFFTDVEYVTWSTFQAQNVRIDDISANLSAIPLPAAGWLLLGGLGGLAALRRRRKAA